MDVIIDVDSVLKAGSEPLLASGSSDTGRLAYTVFRSSEGSLVLMTEETPEEGIRSWLNAEGYSGYGRILCRSGSYLDPLEWKMHTLRKLLATGVRVPLFVSGDTELLRGVSAMGIHQFYVVEPSTKVGELDLDVPYKPWDEVVDTIDEVKSKQAQSNLVDGDSVDQSELSFG